MAGLTKELHALINDWDPLGVADVVPDEYDYLTGPLLERLGEGADRASICEFMYNEARYLGADPAVGDAFGAKVCAWFQAKSPRPEQ